MWKIIKLDKQLANQIAAWEVVERPVSVIKELVENSIDAEATNIKVEIKEAWKTSIIISDNWKGIEKEDLKLSLEKYSTSKIKSLDDLYKVMTFGFRWEALSSISSVSKLTINSKIDSYDFWYSFSQDDWKIEKVWMETWTKIEVLDLFYNTPARLNYLKKDRTEYSHILEFLNSISLSYPKIGFEFISDWKQVFKYKENDNLINRLYKIYGNEFSENALDINFEINSIKITWYISDPKISFPNKNRQVIFVNNRLIKSPLIFRAINDAYNRFIPHSNFPGYIINLELDPREVDVNVHPRKMEIRFASEQIIFRSIYNAINTKLDNVSLINTPNNFETDINSSETNTNNYQEFKSFSWWNKLAETNQKYYTWSWTKFKSYSPYKDTRSNPAQTNIKSALEFSKSLLENENIESQESEEKNDLSMTALGKIIGQTMNSYIIVETFDKKIQILDQHALAERVLYEKLVKSSYKPKMQWLLIAENIDLRPKEIDILSENIETFKSMWFDIEIMWSNNALLNAIPDFLKKEDIKQVFLWVINDISNFSLKSKTLEEVRNKIFAYTACRWSIKFWNKLSIFEMNKLLNYSVLDYSSTCPHGRPVVFEIDLEEIKNKYER